MYLDYWGEDLPKDALVRRKTKSGGFTFSIFWNKVKKQVMRYEEINETLDKLDNKELTYKETKDGCYTLATATTLGIGYFIRRMKKDANNIEVCGGWLDSNDDIRLFRVGLTQRFDKDFGALDAWIDFQARVNKTLNKSIGQIYGGLPLEYHKYRTCVPSPINWASARYTTKTGRIAENCVKADICSAYGTEASKTLPNCRVSLGKVVKGRVKPTEELPFAFYLESGNMAIWNEGDSFELYNSPYITCDHSVFCEENQDKTLLLPAAKESLVDIFTELYDGRKENEDNKFVMNATIGMFHRRETKYQEDNLWPLAAVIKYRCNKRIVDTCEWLKERGQKPILINTDSILWEGEWQDEFYEIFSDEKRLGNFTLEYKHCQAVIRSPKVYQIKDVNGGEVITRWSGPYSTKYTNLLDFGQIWQGKIYEFLRDVSEKNTIQWDKKKRRYINKKGEIYYNAEKEMEEMLLWLKQDLQKSN